ncbi:hypothetical protein RHMOL_Rhmol04G0284000 [Rhododendron molle]|uniref:Uncharacterized protein n=1 Tax=Rhododendron molle TaxID=49168 RepID=A0ACC0P5K8_RHOML|nr:hypothetical protein RHMOL_Rhmol04G0284000 [Rhododendron molle]
MPDIRLIFYFSLQRLYIKICLLSKKAKLMPKQIYYSMDVMFSHPSGRNHTNAKNDPNIDGHINLFQAQLAINPFSSWAHSCAVRTIRNGKRETTFESTKKLLIGGFRRCTLGPFSAERDSQRSASSPTARVLRSGGGGLPPPPPSSPPPPSLRSRPPPPSLLLTGVSFLSLRAGIAEFVVTKLRVLRLPAGDLGARIAMSPPCLPKSGDKWLLVSLSVGGVLVFSASASVAGGGSVKVSQDSILFFGWLRYHFWLEVTADLAEWSLFFGSRGRARPPWRCLGLRARCLAWQRRLASEPPSVDSTALDWVSRSSSGRRPLRRVLGNISFISFVFVVA